MKTNKTKMIKVTLISGDYSCEALERVFKNALRDNMNLNGLGRAKIEDMFKIEVSQ